METFKLQNHSPKVLCFQEPLGGGMRPSNSTSCCEFPAVKGRAGGRLANPGPRNSPQFLGGGGWALSPSGSACPHPALHALAVPVHTHTHTHTHTHVRARALSTSFSHFQLASQDTHTHTHTPPHSHIFNYHLKTFNPDQPSLLPGVPSSAPLPIGKDLSEMVHFPA